MYIHNQTNWPNFIWNNESLLVELSNVRHAEGKLIGKMESLGFELQQQATFKTLTLDILKSTAIEGEILNPKQVRSSLAKRMGVNLAPFVPTDKNVDGIVDMMLDAVNNFQKPLSLKRLLAWHSSLFPNAQSGMNKIIVGKLRNDLDGPMRVVSGVIGSEKVHYEAPSATILKKEIKQFLNWFNNVDNLDPIIKSAIAHFWFVTIHPFEDGNGRISRAISDMLLARADSSSQRFYSMSAEIKLTRKTYYKILEKSQKGTLDITSWILWFINTLSKAVENTNKTLSTVLYKDKFWKKYNNTVLNNRQKSLLNKLLDDFRGKLTTSKYAKIYKCSTDTALRDIQDLIEKGILQKEAAGGRSSSYKLKE